jgi:hypothetical protein
MAEPMATFRAHDRRGRRTSALLSLEKAAASIEAARVAVTSALDLDSHEAQTRAEQTVNAARAVVDGRLHEAADLLQAVNW